MSRQGDMMVGIVGSIVGIVSIAFACWAMYRVACICDSDDTNRPLFGINAPAFRGSVQTLREAHRYGKKQFLTASAIFGAGALGSLVALIIGHTGPASLLVGVAAFAALPFIVVGEKRVKRHLASLDERSP